MSAAVGAHTTKSRVETAADFWQNPMKPTAEAPLWLTCVGSFARVLKPSSNPMYAGLLSSSVAVDFAKYDRMLNFGQHQQPDFVCAFCGVTAAR
jgi:hypothetical protein